MSAMVALLLAAFAPVFAANKLEAPRTWPEWAFYPVEKLGHLVMLPWGPDMGTMEPMPFKLCGYYVYTADELAEINRNRRQARWVGTAVLTPVVVAWLWRRRRRKAVPAASAVEKELATGAVVEEPEVVTRG